MKKQKFVVLALTMSAFLGAASLFGGAGGCGSSSGGGAGGGGSGDLASLTVAETRVGEGSAFNPAVSFFKTDEGGLGFNVSGADVNGDGTVGSPTVSNVEVEAGDQIALVLRSGGGTKGVRIADCGTRDVGSGDADDQFDIAVSLDTTASMGSAAGILAGKIADFASALAEEGVDAQFAGITVGDAFATKLAAGSEFDDTVSRGSLGEPPAFDTCERPDTGTALLSAADMATFFDKVGEAVGSGCSGGAIEENYLGSIELAHNELEWRAGATRVVIGIGDACAHVPTSVSSDGITDPWTPPTGAELEDALSGVATAHWVGNTEAFLGCEGQSLYNMKALADATGGTFTEIGSCGSEDTCNVDLTELPILSSITSGAVTECDFETEDATTVTVCFDVEIEDSDASFCAVLTITAES